MGKSLRVFSEVFPFTPYYTPYSLILVHLKMFPLSPQFYVYTGGPETNRELFCNGRGKMIGFGGGRSGDVRRPDSGRIGDKETQIHLVVVFMFGEASYELWIWGEGNTEIRLG